MGGSQTLLLQQPKDMHTKDKVGAKAWDWVPSSSSHLWLSRDCFSRVQRSTNHVFHPCSSYLSNNTPPLPSTLHALSLKARVPVGRTSSCSHLVMGKLGYTNNISAQNISPRSVEKQWPSYGEAAAIFTIRGLVALLLLLVWVLVSESGRDTPKRRDGLCENGAVCRFEPDRVVFGIGNSLVLFGRKQRYAELVHIQRRATPAQQLVVNGYTVATGKCLLSHGELVPTLPNTPIVLPPPRSCSCPIPSTHSSLDMQEGYYSLIKWTCYLWHTHKCLACTVLEWGTAK